MLISAFYEWRNDNEDDTYAASEAAHKNDSDINRNWRLRISLGLCNWGSRDGSVNTRIADGLRLEGMDADRGHFEKTV